MQWLLTFSISFNFLNNQETDNLSEDSTSEGDSDLVLGFRRSSRVSANHSVKSTFSLSTAVRSMWQQVRRGVVIETDLICIFRILVLLRNPASLYHQKKEVLDSCLESSQCLKKTEKVSIDYFGAKIVIIRANHDTSDVLLIHCDSTSFMTKTSDLL